MPLSDPGRYGLLVGKLNYLIVTRPDISFAVSAAIVRILRYIKSALGKGLLFEDRGHEHIIGYTDVDWAISPFDRRSTSGYCVLAGGNLVQCSGKREAEKKDKAPLHALSDEALALSDEALTYSFYVVARSSAKAECRAMAVATCELVLIKQLLRELKFGEIY
ncbi:uncharacterized mitochondrial protein AtMg00810-like [Solanum tuberosum]|uniref:uncharacterized mitochondrial protein AtMg00810-like n=1 Tax=Solanum tuberosum TaxID=4113 RepID=UPI00073A5350|nr:PREDICTED: uncharacterized mitochondrial protein AtMg00810-like [Solanum tuberosum]